MFCQCFNERSPQGWESTVDIFRVTEQIFAGYLRSFVETKWTNKVSVRLWLISAKPKWDENAIVLHPLSAGNIPHSPHWWAGKRSTFRGYLFLRMGSIWVYQRVSHSGWKAVNESGLSYLVNPYWIKKYILGLWAGWFTSGFQIWLGWFTATKKMKT